MNDEQRARLFEHQDPEHECTPYNGGCGMPHYRFNVTLPNWLEQWPDSSDARQQAVELQESRDWGED